MLRWVGSRKTCSFLPPPKQCREMAHLAVLILGRTQPCALAHGLTVNAEQKRDQQNICIGNFENLKLLLCVQMDK